MNKVALKTFATWARRQLIDQVSIEAARLGLTANQPIAYTVQGDYLTIGTTQYPLAWREAVDSLNQAWHHHGFTRLVEEVAYTWFNRFIAIRYMEVHDYLPSHVRVLSSLTPGQVDPDILLHYRDLPWPLDVAALDQAMSAGNREAVFRQLLIEQCNQLHVAMPFLFEKLKDYTELLLPAHLLHTDSAIRHLVEDIPEDDFQAVEVIGWLYQYYISEKNKQIVGMNKGVVRKEDLPAATQLFTPRWIVQYMVENSLGRAWMAANPSSSLDQSWDYYLFRDEAFPPTPLDVASIKILDPACGSGHILVYAFELLFTMYEELGYSGPSIPAMILKNNLFGLDIDPRATQLATLALVMKAREKDRRFFDRHVVPNVLAFEDADEVPNSVIELVGQTAGELSGLRDLIKHHKNARQFGSLLEGYPVETAHLIDRINAVEASRGDLMDETSALRAKELLPILHQNQMLQDRYDIVVTNPPYHNKYNPVLKDFMAKHYRNYKGDLYSAFIYRCSHWTRANGYTAMMTPFTWMFISSHEKLRKNLLQQFSISSLVQLEYSGFEEATVPICTFVLQQQTDNRTGLYLRLEDFKGPDVQPVKVREATKNASVSYRYRANSDAFHEIPGSPLAYWASEAVRNVFKKGTPLESIARPRQGLATADNDRFLRLWHEVRLDRIGFGCANASEALKSKRKWFPLNKGGAYRKWYGNQDYVVNWEEDGKEVKSYVAERYPYLNGKYEFVVKNESWYFLVGITWSKISSSKFGVRFSPGGFIYDVGGSGVYPEDGMIPYVLAFLTTRVSFQLLQYLNPTLNFQIGNIAALPLVMHEGIKPVVDRLAEENIHISKTDWDDFEASWNFFQHPLLKYRSSASTIGGAFATWAAHAEHRFRKMQQNEEQVNRLFIDLYGLQEELTPEVPDDEITLRQADEVREAKSFLSYFIGCLMGRYSLDVPRLAYAGGSWDTRSYQTFQPVADGIMVLTDDRYFDQDIVGRLEEFLVALYGRESLNENLQWLADRVDRRIEDDAATRLRRYFLQEFFKDHCKVYSKRPIYWLFDSGPDKGFRALVYLHRYTPDTVARVRLEYLQPLQVRVAEELRQWEARLAAGTLSRAERRVVESRIDVLLARQAECVRYDQVLADLANQRVALDLDDGVKVNYAKLQSALAVVK